MIKNSINALFFGSGSIAFLSKIWTSIVIFANTYFITLSFIVFSITTIYKFTQFLRKGKHKNLIVYRLIKKAFKKANNYLKH
ncbi:hypothetical protein EV201_1275 [Ancylomarina subtilis]|uniref:Uncharacterized protein n=1 Tax=Ancylomarina subtilis TaxID=1639035 RepID=A0A4Q7VKG9_9BACT|nr:hypothetical protein EV201_1275 [Ancylomarina subtilis]